MRTPASHPGSVACVISTHRRPALLREALASALAQTQPPEAIFVVDDEGSSSAREVVEATARGAALPVAYLVHGEGPGPSTSRNFGAHAARSEWLAFLDDDDRWLPGYLAAATAASDTDLVLTARWDFDGQGARRPGKVPLPTYDERRWLRRNLGGTGSSTVIRRELFLAIGGYDAKLLSGQDRDLVIRAMRGGARYRAVTERLLEHREDGARISTNARRILVARLRLLWKYRRDMRLGDVRYMLRKIGREVARADWRGVRGTLW
jgi:glycosyltransferase involved in cell wall biosynthesis